MKYRIGLLLILFSYGCGQTETKKVVDKFDNGQEEIVFFFKDNNDTLTYRKEVFFASGKRDYIGNILHNKKDGVWTWWYENGNKKDQCKYADGFYVDTVYHWYPNGKLRQIEIVAGKSVRTDSCCNCNGTIIRYSENGKLQEQFTNLDDKFQGRYITYEDNGGWIIKTYKNDTLFGFTSEHLIDSTGVQIIVGQYENGKETGLWKWFNKDSLLTQTVVYSNGISNGDYIQYFTNGRIKQKGIINDGKYLGQVSYYDSLGKLTKGEYYNKGKLQKTTTY